MIRVVIADDQPLVRTGVRVLIETEDDLELVGEAADGRQALDLVRRTRPDVALLDVRMPAMTGIEALRVIAADPALQVTKVVVLTTFELDEYVFDALSAGASGFLVKDAEPAEMVHAIRVVAAGQALLSPSVTRLVLQRFTARTAPAGPHPQLRALTERERQIAGLVGQGLSNQEIAAQLVVSPETVRTHVSRAMTKLHARDRTQLAVFALQSGLADQGGP